MILTVEAFKRECRGAFPLNQVQKLTEAEAAKVIPGRIKNGTIYGRLQQALDNERGLENDDFDPLDELAEIMEGLTGFNSTSAYSDEDLAQVFNQLLEDDG